MLLLAGCGGGGGGSAGDGGGSGGGDPAIDATITGSVGDGPIVGGNVVIRDRSGQAIGNETSGNQANFQLNVTVTDEQFPLTAEVSDGTDLVTGGPPDFPLVAAAMRPDNNLIVNLTPFSTLIVAIAERRAGGLSESNVANATGAVLSALSFGLDTSQVPDPMTVQVTAENIAGVVKASEALAEMIRRTRDALLVAGQTISAGEVLQTIAADMVDGVLDGRGASGADARVAAVANVVSAQVLLEALINRLHVGGVDATVAMDIAIQQITPSSSAVPLTASVAITGNMLAEARIALQAARSFVSDPVVASMHQTLDEIQQTLDEIQPGVLPEDIESLLPDGSSSALDEAIAQISVATAIELEFINAIVRHDTVAVPAVVGLSQGQAITAITTAILVVGTVSSQTSSTVPVGDVMSQIPVGGTAVTAGSNVNLVVSLGTGAPVISGTPPAGATVGSSYDFTPTASDPVDGPLGLSFDISGQPAWASFNLSTGQLNGDPLSTHIGTYSNISISVSDGAAIATLPVFSIKVKTNVVTLSWTPPTENADGSQPLDLSGYKIYSGPTEDDYTELVDLDVGVGLEYMTDPLSPGTYYFVITAYGNNRIESDYSNIVGATIY